MKSKNLITILASAILILGLWASGISANTPLLVPTLSIEEKTGEKGDTITVDVSISNNTGMQGGEMEIIYDPAIVEPKAFIPGLWSGGMFIYNIDYASDRIFAMFLGDTNVDGVLFSVEFELLETGVSNLILDEVILVGIPTCDLVDGKITVVLSPAQAKAEAEALIDALPEPADTRLAHKADVEAARAAVDLAVDLGVDETTIDGILKLEGCEAKIQAIEDAIDNAEDAITFLPDPANITLADRAEVEAARALVDAALAEGAVAGDFDATLLAKLEACEAKLQAIDDAIEDAEAAITALPDPADITLADRADVEAARALVNAALDLGAVEDDFNAALLAKLEACEAKIQEYLDAIADAIDAAETAIAALPDADDIILADRADVEAARDLVDEALDLGADISQFDANLIAKLEACEAKLQAIDDAITAAEAAIDALPAPADITLADRADVEAARTLFYAALAEGALNPDFDPILITKLEDCDIKILELLAAIAAAEAAIDSLPDPADITLADRADVEAARALVDAALAEGAVAGDFDATLLAKLEACEAKIQAINDAIAAAVAAIDALPDPGDVELTDLDDILAARDLLDAAFAEGALEGDFDADLLAKLAACEEIVAELLLIAAIDEANQAVAGLKDPDDITLEDADAVAAARALVDAAVVLGADPGDFTDLEKLEAAEEKIALLLYEAACEAAKEAVETAEASKQQEDVDAARELVASLPDGDEKDALLARLDAIVVDDDDDDDDDLPVTGSLSYMLFLGLLLAAAGALMLRRRKSIA